MLQGVSLVPQKCHEECAPTSFIWCQLRIAEMPIEQRTKGRVICRAQQCCTRSTLPNQFNGDTDMTQQCLDHNSPRERPTSLRRNAKTKPPLPFSHRGRHDHAEMPKSERSTREANAQMQQYQSKSTSLIQSQGAMFAPQKCH